MILGARVDKWLWAVRIFKSRSLAADACRRGRVVVCGRPAKASRLVGVGDVVCVRRGPVTFSFVVKQAVERRVGARFVADVLEDVTAKEQLELLEMSRIGGFVNRARGLGRPTKKDRRDLDEFMLPEYLDDLFDLSGDGVSVED